MTVLMLTEQYFKTQQNNEKQGINYLPSWFMFSPLMLQRQMLKEMTNISYIPPNFFYTILIDTFSLAFASGTTPNPPPLLHVCCCHLTFSLQLLSPRVTCFRSS